MDLGFQAFQGTHCLETELRTPWSRSCVLEAATWRLGPANKRWGLEWVVGQGIALRLHVLKHAWYLMLILLLSGSRIQYSLHIGYYCIFQYPIINQQRCFDSVVQLGGVFLYVASLGPAISVGVAKKCDLLRSLSPPLWCASLPLGKCD